MAADPLKEPTADQRGVAQQAYGFFNALVREGFSEQQALMLVGTILQAIVTGTILKGDDK